MKVKDLAIILNNCDPEMEIGSFANNHIHHPSPWGLVKVGLWLHLNSKGNVIQEFIMIGNFDKYHADASNKIVEIF